MTETIHRIFDWIFDESFRSTADGFARSRIHLKWTIMMSVPKNSCGSPEMQKSDSKALNRFLATFWVNRRHKRIQWNGSQMTNRNWRYYYKEKNPETWTCGSVYLVVLLCKYKMYVFFASRERLFVLVSHVSPISISHVSRYSRWLDVDVS